MPKTRRNRQRGGWEWLDKMKSTVTGAVDSAKNKWGQPKDTPLTAVPILSNGSDIPPIGGRYRRSRRSRVRKWR